MNLKKLDEDYYFSILIFLKNVKRQCVQWIYRDDKMGIYKTKILCMELDVYLKAPSQGAITLMIDVYSPVEHKVVNFTMRNYQVWIERENLTLDQIWDYVVCPNK